MIEACLTRTDAAVAALQPVQANLKRAPRAVLKAACEGRLVPTEAELARQEGREYEPADVLLEHILAQRRARWEAEELAKFDRAGKKPKGNAWKQNYKKPATADTVGLPDLPEGWTIASVDQLTFRITSGSRDWARYYGRGSGTFIMAQNVRMGRFELSYRQTVDPPADDSSRERSQVHADDLLVTIVGENTGDVCQISGEHPEYYVCQSVALMRPVGAAIARFIELYLVSPENGRRQYGRYMYGAGRPHLSFEQLNSTAILFTSRAEQERIVGKVERRLSALDAMEATVAVDLRRADRLRQPILKRAFEGNLVPQDPSDEPASALLERIRADRNGVAHIGRPGRVRRLRSQPS